MNGRSVPTPWEGHLAEWGEEGGVRVPLAGEVAWLLPEGRRGTWRGRITSGRSLPLDRQGGGAELTGYQCAAPAVE